MSDRTAARRMKQHRLRKKLGRIRSFVDVHENNAWDGLLEAELISPDQHRGRHPRIFAWALSLMIDRLCAPRRSP
jgi:hypothetical protein